MSNEVEYDPFEYAKELEAGADLGRSDFEERREPSGLTRGGSSSGEPSASPPRPQPVR